MLAGGRLAVKQRKGGSGLRDEHVQAVDVTEAERPSANQQWRLERGINHIEYRCIRARVIKCCKYASGHPRLALHTKQRSVDNQLSTCERRVDVIEGVTLTK